MDDEEFDKHHIHYWELWEQLLYESYTPTDSVRDRAWLTESHIPQGQLFMILMLPVIMKYVGKCGRELKIADIGCGMGAGTQLLAGLVQSRFFGDREIQVYGFDSLNIYERYNRAFNKDVTFAVESLEDMSEDEMFDMTVSSNMFEHFDDPAPLIEKMKSITKRFAIILIPYNEPLKLEPDHLTSFTDDLIDSFSPCEVQHSSAVGTDQSDQVCFVLDCREKQLKEVMQDAVREGIHRVAGQNMRTRLSRHLVGRLMIRLARLTGLSHLLRRLA